MQQNSKDALKEKYSDNLGSLQFLVGDVDRIFDMPEIPVKGLFDELIVDFFARLSKELMHTKRAKAFSDVLSYAFWVRSSSIWKEKERFFEKDGTPKKRKLGRGVAFHIAPSNVAVNFAVSFTSALLAGNPCIVRVSNKEFEQVDLIVGAINHVMDELPEMKKYLVIVRYEHSKELTDILSSICDLRIVWGGNRTLSEVRQSPLPPRAIEMAFPDRHSLAIVNANEYLSRDAKKVADDFYIDTYFTDQNACSSPRLIVWMGSDAGKIEEAKEKFYQTLKTKLDNEYDMAPILAIDKWNALCEFSATHEGVALQSDNNVLVRIKVDSLTSDLMDYKMGGGYFFEYEAEDIKEVVPVLTKPCQTISYLGIDQEKIYEMVAKNGVRGVDRIVPMGHTMDLSFFWDGYDMIDTMSRYVDVHREMGR